MATTARLFTALWPPATVREAVLAQCAHWHWPPGARRVAPDKLHLTLHFLGSVPAARLAELDRALAGPVEPFDLCFDGAAVWANGVALLVPSRLPPELVALHRRQATALRALGLAVEPRRWRPHLTLARDARGATPPAAAPAIAWPVQGAVLVQSLPDGRYLPLAH